MIVALEILRVVPELSGLADRKPVGLGIQLQSRENASHACMEP